MEKPAADAPAADSVGVGPLDRVRELIVGGMWSQAQSDLSGLMRSADGRVRALANLYQAVVVAEAGLGSGYADPAGRYGKDADAGFRQVLQDLEGASASDRLRAHHDYANFLLRQAQDRLHNHAFQMAAGVEHPLLTAMIAWGAAQRQYETARDLAASAEDRAAIDVSLARLYALLAEIVATIDARGGDAALAAINGAALRQGLEYASRAVAEEAAAPAGASADGSFIVAMAEEMKAQLAFRLGDWKTCKEHAEAAQALYGRMGSLVGEESIHRLLGLYYLRESIRHTPCAVADGTRRVPDTLKSDLSSRQTALEHFPHFSCAVGGSPRAVSRRPDRPEPSRLLRPPGLRRRNDRGAAAGAGPRPGSPGIRRGRQVAGAEDLLLTAGIHAGSDAPAQPDTGEILAHWPRGVAALEYFLGRQRAWVFLIDVNAKVKACPLSDAEGNPLDSRDLLTRIHAFLNQIGFQAAAMRRRLMAGQGYDHAWQETLHRFQRELLPRAALDALRKADTVIVVPQHLLHYFPFAALVTEVDKKPRSADEMVQPRFLLDEPFDLSYAPSLGSWAIVRQRRNRPLEEASMVGLVEVAGEHSLPGVARDLENVKAVFHDRLGGVYFADAATVANAKRALGHPGLLLLATHGMNAADRPLESFVVLQPQGGNDGRLTAAELFQTRVAADLVVMNACYSGLADASPLPGDDLFGLQRALLQAGARTVVAGLWDVLRRHGSRADPRPVGRRGGGPGGAGGAGPVAAGVLEEAPRLDRSGALAAPVFLGRVHRGRRRPHRGEEMSHIPACRFLMPGA